MPNDIIKIYNKNTVLMISFLLLFLIIKNDNLLNYQVIFQGKSEVEGQVPTNL